MDEIGKCFCMFFEQNEACKKHIEVHPKCIKIIIAWTNVRLTNFPNVLMKFKHHK